MSIERDHDLVEGWRLQTAEQRRRNLLLWTGAWITCLAFWALVLYELGAPQWLLRQLGVDHG